MTYNSFKGNFLLHNISRSFISKYLKYSILSLTNFSSVKYMYMFLNLLLKQIEIHILIFFIYIYIKTTYNMFIS